MNRFDFMGKEAKEALNRMEEMMNASRLNELLHKKEEDEKKKSCILWVLAIIGAVAAVAGIAYAVYRFFTRIIWKILKMTLTTTLMMISLKMTKKR